MFHFIYKKKQKYNKKIVSKTLIKFESRTGIIYV